MLAGKQAARVKGGKIMPPVSRAVKHAAPMNPGETCNRCLVRENMQPILSVTQVTFAFAFASYWLESISGLMLLLSKRINKTLGSVNSRRLRDLYPYGNSALFVCDRLT